MASTSRGKGAELISGWDKAVARRIDRRPENGLRGVNSHHSVDAALLLPGTGGAGHCPARGGAHVDPDFAPHPHFYTDVDFYAAFYAYFDANTGVYTHPVLADDPADGDLDAHADGYGDADRYAHVHCYTDEDIYTHSHCHRHDHRD